MARKVGDTPTKGNTSNVGKDLFDIKRLDKARKGWYAKGYGMTTKGRRRKVAMDYVSPGDGGY